MMDWILLVGFLALAFYVFFFSSPAWLLKKVGDVSRRLHVIDAELDGLQNSREVFKSNYGNFVKAVKRIDERLNDVESRLAAIEGRFENVDMEKQMWMSLLPMLGGGSGEDSSAAADNAITGSKLRKLGLNEGG